MVSQNLRFETPGGECSLNAPVVVLGLGGGSWARLGSTGEWTSVLAARGIPLAAFRPSNCGFEVEWSEHFRTRFEGHPLKSVVLEFTNSDNVSLRRQGEFIITNTGVEGSLIYALSAPIRNEIELHGTATLHLDLAPDRPHENLIERLSQARGSRSISSHLEKSLGIRDVKAGLLWEFVPRVDFNDPQKLATAIKRLPVPLKAARPLDEAISSAGGICFEALDKNLMLKNLPGVFCAGEMLDWEAPTGGYLITACCSTGRAAGLGALRWLGQREKGI